MSAPVITFLSDYGLQDEFVGVCHGVIAGICPHARVIDITHGIHRQDVRAGAIVLRGALPYMPVGIHLAVVDPDVGGARRAVALRLANERILVGPDNGLLSVAANDGGGVAEAVDIGRSQFCLEPVSATFHGRDVFAPVAARLAAGASLAEAGEPFDPAQLVTLALLTARIEDSAIVTHVTYVDRFGNAQLDAGPEEMAQAGLRLGRGVELQTGSGEAHHAVFERTFADVAAGELLLYEDSSRRLAVAISHGSAAERLVLDVGDEVRIEAR